MNAKQKAQIVLAIALIVFPSIFLAGRYGWRLGGFGACQGAGLTRVEVCEGEVRLEGFCPGSSPEGFCGCYSEERDGKLYVGFRFSAVFGLLERGSFSVTIPVRGDIGEVILKTGAGETSVWNAGSGATLSA
ncbi:MAG: hypothetical protein ACI4P5_06000 [Candidatus Fimadaptatus sp.]